MIRRHPIGFARTGLLGLAFAAAAVPCLAQSGPAPAGGAAAAALEVSAVETDGTAVFHLCRGGLMEADCRVYGHVHLPFQVRRGDAFGLSFGSNSKRIIFRVDRILHQGAGCDVLADTGDGEPDRLTSRRCKVLETEPSSPAASGGS